MFALPPLRSLGSRVWNASHPSWVCLLARQLFSASNKLPIRIYLLTAFTKLRSCFLSSIYLFSDRSPTPSAESNLFVISLPVVFSVAFSMWYPSLYMLLCSQLRSLIPYVLQQVTGTRRKIIFFCKSSENLVESFTEWRVEGVVDITDAGVEEWTRGEKSVPGT